MLVQRDYIHRGLPGRYPAIQLAKAESQICLVVGVSDGDTLTARCGTERAYDQIKARFNGIARRRRSSRSASV
ncbi:hypothetical protein GmRootV59_22730 [Variovorax sp. V59]|uniref:hypothetical protein n=1 Tax=unclassified Variovorax TaxID=663243 RepID=UPI0034E89232